MTDSKAPPTFRRAAAPAGRSAVPTGQTNTAAIGPNGTLRLNKRMAELGLASRREADEWIGKGWVQVTGEVATMGMQVAPNVRIEITKQAQGQQATNEQGAGEIAGVHHSGFPLCERTKKTAARRVRKNATSYFFNS